MKKYFKLFLAFVLALVTVTTLTSCFSKTMTPEGMLKKFKKYSNAVTSEVFRDEETSQLKAFEDMRGNKINIEEIDQWYIADLTACDKQLIKGDFRDVFNVKGKYQEDQQNGVGLYDVKLTQTEKMNIKGFSGKVNNTTKFKGGYFEENNTYYEFDSINKVKEEHSFGHSYTLSNTKSYGDSSYKYYVDNNGSLLTYIEYDDSNNIVAMHQYIFSDNKWTEIYYKRSEFKKPLYIENIGAYFVSTEYELTTVTVTFKDGNLTAPNIDSYELGNVREPEFF